MILFEIHDNKDKFLFPIRRAVDPSFRALLQEDGTAQFSLLRSDPQTARVQEGQIVHVYVNGQDVFTWVIEESSEAYGESGNDLITFSGRDTRVILDYAIIYPDGWPPIQQPNDPRLPVYGASILQNGEFEKDGQGDVAPWWVTYPQPNITYSNSVDNGTVREADKKPTKSLRVQTSASIPLTMIARQSGLFNSDQRRLDGTSKWRIAAACRITEITGLSFNAKIVLKWYNSRGELLGQDEDNMTQNQSWERLEKTVTVTSDANQFAVELYVRGQATFDFDLVRLEAVYDDTLPTFPTRGTSQFTYGPNKLINGTFDGIIVAQKPPSHWNFFEEIPVARIDEVVYADLSAGEVPSNDQYNTKGFTINRALPEQEGLVAWQDIPVEEGKGYHLSSVLAAIYTNNVTPIGQGLERTWFRRKWLDVSGNQIGDTILDKATVINGRQTQFKKMSMATRYEFPTKVAPYGARSMRLEVLAPPQVLSPLWDNVEIKRGSASVIGDVSGVTKTYIKARIPVIIEDILLETASRMPDWPIRPGLMEYNRDYDVYDGVLIPKDELAAVQYRFDHVGSTVRSLALTTNGDLTLRGMTKEEQIANNGSYLVCDYQVQKGVDRSGTVRFIEAVDVVDVPEKSHSLRDVRTRLVVEGQGSGMSAVTTVVDDPDLQVKYGVREGYLDQKNNVHYIDLKRIGKATMKELDTQTQVFTITVSTHKYKPFQDYFLGDSVRVILPHINLDQKYRIMGITVQPEQGGDLDTVQIDLDAAAYDAFSRVAKAQQSSVSAIGAIQRLPQGSITLYQVNGEDDLDKEHPYTFRFFVPSTPIFTNQIRLAFQGLPFRSNIKITGDSGMTPAGQVPIRTITTSIWDGEKNLPPPPGSTSTTGVGGFDFLTIAPENGATRNPDYNPGTIDPGPVDTGPTINLTHSHTVTVPAVPAHTHQSNLKVEYGLFESTTPEKLKVKVNSVDLDPNVYGYSDDGANDLEIGSLIRKGWNTVTFSSNRLGRITTQVVIQTYLSNEITGL